MSNKLSAFLKTARESDGYWIEKAKLGFAMALERWRKTKGLNNSELAQKIDVSPAYITKVFRGDCNFTIETMVKLARACDGQLSIQIVSPSVDAKTWLSKTAESRQPILLTSAATGLMKSLKALGLVSLIDRIQRAFGRLMIGSLD